mmetsp:Transcript_19863/g.17557  ORF Transcript_19863/g.17557 Transcript_19863/m.17557 type:complete len:90 (-) Transcript_19863:11-280(-)
MYDIIFSLGGRLDKVNPAKELSQKFQRWVSKQYKGLPLEQDSNIMKKREERSWLYYEDKKENKLKDILTTIGVQRIDVSKLFKARDKAP